MPLLVLLLLLLLLGLRLYCRYRLQLRSADQSFFADNFIHCYLPTQYFLSMKLDSPANAAGDYHEAAQQHHQRQQRSRRSSSSTGSNAQPLPPAGSNSRSSSAKPLDNETWWRLYCAGDVLACYLSTAMQNGLNLQV